jgi:uncharacterized protein YcbK (DUF882 family)
MGDLSEHFSKSEFACQCGCGYGTRVGDISQELLNILERIRIDIDRPMRVSSGCRCTRHNATVGGVPNSAHTRGVAADIFVSDGGHRRRLMDLGVKHHVPGIGIAKTFVHYDVDTVKRRPSCWSY